MTNIPLTQSEIALLIKAMELLSQQTFVNHEIESLYSKIESYQKKGG